jgi:hypothetical protein
MALGAARLIFPPRALRQTHGGSIAKGRLPNAERSKSEVRRSAEWHSADLSHLEGGERDGLSQAKGRPIGASARAHVSQTQNGIP